MKTTNIAMGDQPADPQADRQAYSVLGHRVDVLLSSHASGGQAAIYEVTVGAGMSVPLHVHRRDDENFYVLEGVFEIQFGERILVANAGDFVHLERGVPHRYANVGDAQGRLLGIGIPGGHELFFADMADLSFPPDPAQIAAICGKHGVEILAQDGV